MMMDPFSHLYALLSVYCLIACLVNHIDDTDETYGYFEPLHFLLYGTGMQTWEYSPEYAIRTYAFVLPFLPICRVLSALGCSKITTFFAVRLILGQGFAWSASRFLMSIKRLCGWSVGICSLIFMLASPGVFFCSTAFLPSAVCASFVMAAVSSWSDCDHPRLDLSGYFGAILFGCVAVVSSGWPFVAVVFAPLGVHMVGSCFLAMPGRKSYNSVHHTSDKEIVEENSRDSYTRSEAWTLLLLVSGGAATLLLTSAIVVAIDSAMYSQFAFPPLNIALYNALSGSGDELYGIEPASYYLKNLLLTVGLVVFPLSLLSPLAVLFHYETSSPAVTAMSQSSAGKGKVGTLLVAAFSWMLLLLSRPHKEERFMYPIYPLLVFLAAVTLDASAHLALRICSRLASSFSPPSPAPSTSSSPTAHRVVTFFVSFLALPFGVSRIAASHRNYGGYFNLWTEASNIIAHDLAATSAGTGARVTVCMGGEWYTFPSHFFLPAGAELSYVRDNFHGQLPQPFSSTHETPLQNMNDQNEEEMARYTNPDSCDFFVLSVSQQKEQARLTPLQDYVLRASTSNGSGSGSGDNGVTRRHCEPLIDPQRSLSVIARAFSVPYFLSSATNSYSDYCLFQNNNILKK